MVTAAAIATANVPDARRTLPEWEGWRAKSVLLNGAWEFSPGDGGDRAYVLYFTHSGRRSDSAKDDLYEQRRSSIQVAELEYKDGRLSCDRDKPTSIQLRPSH
jgi:hypothetical protein